MVNKTLTSVEIDQYDDALSTDFFHIRAKIDLGYEKVVRGFGSGSTQEEALIKALGELVERSVFFKLAHDGHASTSNGFACHPLASEAHRKATNELIERDIVMSNWLVRKPPFWFDLKTDASDIYQKFHADFELFEKFQLTLDFGIWGVINDVSVFVVAMKSTQDNFGFSFASTANTCLLSSIESLISDSRRAATMLIGRRLRGSPLFQSLDSREILTPQDHREYYFNPCHKDKIDWFWNSDPNITTIRNVVINTQLYNPTFNLPWDVLVSRATCKGMQGYFVGTPKIAYLNFDRFDAGIANLQLLNSMPHPLA